MTHTSAGLAVGLVVIGSLFGVIAGRLWDRMTQAKRGSTL